MAPATLSRLTALVLVALPVAGCGVYDIPNLETQAKATFAEVREQYRSRAELVPKLVEAIGPIAAQEREALAAVDQAFARATGVKVEAGTVQDRDRFREYQDTQNGLTGALGRVFDAVERAPDLAADRNIVALRTQIRASEDRAGAKLRDYNGVARAYNSEMRAFPSIFWAIIWGAKAMAVSDPPPEGGPRPA